MARIGLALALALAVCLAYLPVGTSEAQGARTVVVGGLESPRGLAFGPDGKLYVAEAGTGGDEQTEWVPPFRTARFGNTGRILRVDGGETTVVASGLQSVALGPASEMVGVHDLVFVGSTIYALVGQANPLPTGKQTSSLLVKVGADGKVETVADLGKYERDNNPDGTVPDSNPFGLAIGPDGSLWVAEAGGNALLKVTPSGEISTVTAWKDNPVPTAVAFDREGRAYVSFLSPNPFAPGSARVDRVTGSTAEVHVPGLMTVVDVKVGPDGNLYILEHAGERLMGPPPSFKENSGRVLRVTPNGLEQMATGLNHPTKMAFGPDGALYVSNNAVVQTPKSGEIVKLTLPATGTPIAAAPAAQPSPAAKPAGQPAPAAPAASAPAAQPSPAAKPAGPPAQAPAAKPAAVASPAALPRTGAGPDLAGLVAPFAAAGTALTAIGLGLLHRRRR